jgi:integrase
MAAYALALDGGAEVSMGARRCQPGSVSAAVAFYLTSTDFSKLAMHTQRDRRSILDRFREIYGEQPFAKLTRKHVQRLLALKADKPHAAKSLLKALRAVVAVAIRVDLRTDDPTLGIQIKLPKSQGIRTWTESEVAQFESYWPIGTRERLAFALLLYTGQRRSDILKMGRQHLRAGFLSFGAQQKTGAVVEIPIHAELQAILDASVAGNLTTEAPASINASRSAPNSNNNQELRPYSDRPPFANSCMKLRT